MPESTSDRGVSAGCPGPVPFGPGRRDFLRFGIAGLTGLGLTDLLRLRAQACASSSNPARADTAVILVWCHGGASHLETYDPKPQAAPEYRGPFGAISTNVPGLQFSELMPLQARIADKCAIVRSVSHRGVCHQQGLQTLLTGKEQLVLKNRPDHPDAFCVAARIREQPGSALPVHVGIPSLPYGGPAYLGPGYEPFVVRGDPNAPDFAVPDIQIKDGTRERFERRLKMVRDMDALRRGLDHSAEVKARDQHYHAAVDMLTGASARAAFDLGREDAPTRERYGRTRWGQQLLLARRLVEAGVSAVTTSLFGVEKGVASNWDDHAVNWDCFKAMQERAPVFDRAVSALIEDLYARGLDKKVLVIVTGEFGRTPRVNPGNGRAGRDHWPYAMSILLAGGGLRTGQVIGATDPRGEYVVDRPLSPNDLLATLYQHLGIDTSVEFPDRSGRPFRILDRDQPIPELV